MSQYQCDQVSYEFMVNWMSPTCSTVDWEKHENMNIPVYGVHKYFSTYCANTRFFIELYNKKCRLDLEGLFKFLTWLENCKMNCCFTQVRARLLVNWSAVFTVSQEVQVSAAVLCGLQKWQCGPSGRDKPDGRGMASKNYQHNIIDKTCTGIFVQRYSKTCLNWHLCKPFPWVIRSGFSFPFVTVGAAGLRNLNAQCSWVQSIGQSLQALLVIMTSTY